MKKESKKEEHFALFLFAQNPILMVKNRLK
jgi:hypothetical protein